MSEYETVKNLMLKTKGILDLLQKIDIDDPLLLKSYLLVEHLQIQLLELISEYRNLLVRKIDETLRMKIIESLQIITKSYENIQKIIVKSHIYKYIETEQYLTKISNSKQIN